MSKKEKDGAELFDAFYSGIWKERWPALKASLLSECKEMVAIEGLRNPYYIDRASYQVALSLPVRKGDSVLDMCAAPGGKSLVIATRLQGTGCLVANDRSPDRRTRLRQSLSNCLEATDNIKVTGFDASRWGLYEKEAYDAVLLDAPCSSERHVINDPKHLSIWTPSRPKRLCREQYAMLASAFLALRKGGYLLYSTCSINLAEDSMVISRYMERHEGEAVEERIGIEGAEALEYGNIILPDAQNGRGPMYCCLLRKA
ncbi:MAG: RsmB/NOP family class I SAM-dependent RNA methyltransferase [Candidatus Ornithospirochaeta sp.]|nr:RsmB/NOP family class I SAM-dependent RNA methyltransferase [Candidatus Ornithospirochaeta sp.]